MWHRLRTLVLMQLSEKLDLSFLQNKGRMMAKIAIKTGVLIALVFVISMAINLFQQMLFIPVDRNILLAFLFFTQIIAILTCTKGLVQTLYLSKDNAILLSLPSKHSEIFVSKLIVYYIYEIRKNLLLILPLYFGYALSKNLTADINVAYYFKVVFLTGIIPFFPVLIGAIISIPLVFITNFLKRHPLINSLVIGALALLGVWVVYSLVGFVTEKEFLRLDVFVRIVRDGVNQAIPVFNRWSLFYNFINRFLFNDYSFSAFATNGAYILGLIIVLLVLVFTVSMPTYFKLANHSFNSGIKHKYNPAMKPSNNTFQTFLKKEVKTLIRSSDQLASNFVYLLLLPCFIYILNLIYLSLKLSARGEKIVIGMNLLIGLMLLMASNVMSATALSREGSEFYLLKTAPSKTQNIAWAKITVNIVFSTLVIVVTTVALSQVGVMDVFSVIGLGVIMFFVNTGHIFWSYELDLMNPKFQEFASSQTIDDNPNATKSILIGSALSFIFTILLVFFIFEDFSGGWIRVIIVSFVFMVVRLYLLINKMNVYFSEIE